MANDTTTGEAGTAKLVQYLTEAYGKEKELETSLTAHIGMATRPIYKKRLQDHLKETRQHAKQVERRLKKLGGAGVTGKANELLSRGVAAAKGPLHAARGTGEAEKQLKNAKTEYSEEHEEIATYTAIETLATELGDTETAKMAKGIRREEERMASFLEKQIPILTKEVVKQEVPASERRKPARRRSASSRSRSSGSSGGSRSSSSSSRKSASSSGGSRKASSSARSGGSKSSSSSSRKSASSSGGRKTSSSSGRKSSSSSRSSSGGRKRSGARS
jgi:ferritin-like metal-binding protein YciE